MINRKLFGLNGEINAIVDLILVTLRIIESDKTLSKKEIANLINEITKIKTEGFSSSDYGNIMSYVKKEL